MTELRQPTLCTDDDRTMVDLIAGELVGPRTVVWPRQGVLNDREAATLTWAARGKTSAEIAMILGLAKRTVDFHADNARRKLKASTRMEAVAKAAIGQLIAP